MQYYYQKTNPEYRKIPRWAEKCQRANSSPMELISPENAEEILIPVELDGTKGKLSIHVAHRSSEAVIYWHLDDEYLGTTEGLHQKEMLPTVGSHLLTLVDQDGNTLSKSFQIVK